MIPPGTYHFSSSHSHSQLEAEGDGAMMRALGDCTACCAYVLDLDSVASKMAFSLLSKYLQVLIIHFLPLHLHLSVTKENRRELLVLLSAVR